MKTQASTHLGVLERLDEDLHRLLVGPSRHPAQPLVHGSQASDGRPTQTHTHTIYITGASAYRLHGLNRSSHGHKAKDITPSIAWRREA